MIMIGHCFRLFHQRTLEEHTRIPLLNAFPDIVDKIKYQYRPAQNSLKAWDEAGISVTEIHARNRAGWEQIFELYEEGKNVPFDVLNPLHRPKIEEALDWVQCLVNTRGQAVNESQDI
jgi:2-oxo-4-hydroxy-4-carboxy--5-ureidoimidazoline (OHCU) decarboxylase